MPRLCYKKTKHEEKGNGARRKISFPLLLFLLISYCKNDKPPPPPPRVKRPVGNGGERKVSVDGDREGGYRKEEKDYRIPLSLARARTPAGNAHWSNAFTLDANNEKESDKASPRFSMAGFLSFGQIILFPFSHGAKKEKESLFFSRLVHCPLQTPRTASRHTQTHRWCVQSIIAPSCVHVCLLSRLLLVFERRIPSGPVTSREIPNNGVVFLVHWRLHRVHTRVPNKKQQYPSKKYAYT